MSDLTYEQLQHKRLHFLGIGGRGMSAMAQIARIYGAQVTGCDKGESYTTKALQEQGIPVQIGHSASHLDGVDAFIYVPAVTTFDPDTPEFVEAQKRGIPCLTWQELLGKWAAGRCALASHASHARGGSFHKS